MRRLVLGDVGQMVDELRHTGVRAHEVRETVARVLDDVRRRGDAAVRDCTGAFDKVTLPDPLAVPTATMDEALAALDGQVAAALRTASANINEYHRREAPAPWRVRLPQGQTVGQEILPMACAGLYVPGGLADYPSTVLMTAIPAQVAGVETLVVCSPPRADGGVARGVAAVCAMLGVRHLFPIGGAQAIGAMAFGTASVPRCDVIVGPGNAFVTEAKRQVVGEVAIDGLAGPSEVLIVADEDAVIPWLAADVLAQAEHGAGAMGAVLLTHPGVADRLAAEVARLAGELGVDVRNVTIVECGSVDAAVDLVNRFGPEHLELHVADADRVLPKIHSAGAVFLGPSTATAFADYAAGTNHVLPTGGSSRFSQGLSVDAFVRRVAVLSMDESSAAALAGPVACLARHEGLPAHALSAELRAGASTPGSVEEERER